MWIFFGVRFTWVGGLLPLGFRDLTFLLCCNNLMTHGFFLCDWGQIYLGWRSARREWALIRSHLSHGKHGIFERHFLVKMKEDIFSVSWGLENALYLKIIVLHLKIPILQCAVIWLSLCYYFNVDYVVLAWNTSRIKHKNISDFFKSTAGVGRRGIRCWLNWRSGCNPNAICSTQFQFSIQANSTQLLNWNKFINTCINLKSLPKVWKF